MTGRGKILTLRALGLGDLLTAVPALRAVRRAWPEHTHALATPRAWWPLARLTGAVDELVDVRELGPLPQDLAPVEVGVNLHGKGPQSTRRLLEARPDRLLAYRHPALPETAGGPAHHDDEHEVHRWCRLLAAYGVEADPTDLDLAPPDEPPPTSGPDLSLIHVGAKDRARRWPEERFAAVAKAERRRGQRVVLTGSAAERPRALRIAGAAGLEAEAVLAGRTTLRQLAALVFAARRVLSGDTGVAHLATAFRTPSVTLFGPVPPSHWGPPPREQHIALWKGSRGDPHGLEVDPGLFAIDVEEVVEALATVPPPGR